MSISARDTRGAGAVPERAAVSPWSPFGYRAFALLWTAGLISNIGTWMHDVGAGWLMTTLDPSPGIVSLVQAATTLPIFLFALLAGSLADRLDKRRLLITINLGLSVIVALLAVLVMQEQVTPVTLILFTFAIGTGAAFLGPAWQSVVPSLIPRENLQAAIALNSLGFNISRAIGPAIAGLLITAVGVSAPFALNAVSHLVIIAALLIWKPERRAPDRLPPEPLFASMLEGVRHASFNVPLKATLVRAAGFFLFASAYWSLLPLIARQLPGGGPELYGALLGTLGAGAVAGALLLPKFRMRFDSNAAASGGVIVTAISMLTLAFAPTAVMAIAAAFLGGMGWITVLTSLNVSAQTALPNWVRARGLAIYMMTFFGSMALGATIWGQVAELTTIHTSLAIAAVAVVIAIPLTSHCRLGQGEALDLSPAGAWPTPRVRGNVELGRGPVLVTVRYRIDPANEAEFLAAIHALSGERYRDGAYQWGVFQDTSDPAVWNESFMLSNWAEHLRQHERVTEHDRRLQEAVHQWHTEASPPTVEHWLAPAREAQTKTRETSPKT